MKPKNSVTSWLDVEEACFDGAKLDGADISVIDLKRAAGLTRADRELSFAPAGSARLRQTRLQALF